MEEQTYIERIKQVDPFVKSIAQLNPDAVPDAIERDRERQDGYIRGLVTSPRMRTHSDDCNRPLHGVPILLKDTFATLDSMDTTGLT